MVSMVKERARDATAFSGKVDLSDVGVYVAGLKS